MPRTRDEFKSKLTELIEAEYLKADPWDMGFRPSASVIASVITYYLTGTQQVILVDECRKRGCCTDMTCPTHGTNCRG